MEQTEEKMKKMLKSVDVSIRDLYKYKLSVELSEQCRKLMGEQITPAFKVGDVVREKYPASYCSRMLWEVTSVNPATMKYEFEGYAKKYRGRYLMGLDFYNQDLYMLVKKAKHNE
jgi:hypothetical protein